MKKILILINVFLGLVLVYSQEVFGYGWGFKRNSENIVPDVGIYAKEIEDTDSYYYDTSKEKNVYITFDAGYDNGILPQILDVLKDKNVRCTFFVTGDFLTREKDLVKRIVDENHIVGNHTWGHKNITKISKESLKEEIQKVENAYKELIGTDMIKYFRPPEGEFNKQSLLNVKELGYKTFFWSIAYKDWDTKKQNGAEYSFKTITDNMHDGAIILLHTVSEDNLKCLPKLIDWLNENQYKIKNLDEFI